MTRPISNVYANWTNSGVSYTGIGINVTATGYATGSYPFRINVNGNPIFSIDPSGTISNSNTINAVYRVANSAFNYANTISVASGFLANISGTQYAGSLYFPYGNVGIGLTSTNIPLAVASNTTTYQIGLYGPKTNVSSLIGANGNDLSISANGSQRVFVDASGNVTFNNSTTFANSSVSNTIYANTITSNTVTSNIAAYSVKLTGSITLKFSNANQGYLLHNGVLYSTSGTNSNLTPYVGRGASLGTHFGWDNMKAVNFPNETSAYIIDFGQIGPYDSYCLFSNGNLYTWGSNGNGQLGTGDTSARYIPTLVATGVTNAYGCFRHSYATSSRLFILKNDGYLYATGYNGYGQLGVGDTSQRNSFTQLTSLGTGIIGVWPMGTDYGSTFVQKSDYSIWAFGLGNYGQLGTFDTNNYSSPQDVTSKWGGGSGKRITKMTGACGGYTSSGYSYPTFIMLLDDGTNTYVRTCGYDGNGETGHGSTGSISTPYLLSGALPVGRVADIAYVGGCNAGRCFALMGTGASAGNLYTWGYNYYGEMGGGLSTGTTYSSPTLSTTGVAAILNDGKDNYEYGYQTQTFIRKTDNALYAAGFNNYYDLGVGDTSNRTSWTKVLLPGNFVCSQMAWITDNWPTATYIALGADGRLYAWGYNGNYQITSDNNNNVGTPVQINLPLGG